MEPKDIKIGKRWYHPKRKQVYEVWCVANLGFMWLDHNDPVVVLKCLTAKGGEPVYYTMDIDNFPGALEERV